MKPTAEQLVALVDRVRAPIFRRPAPPPKPRKTWHKYKAGDRLTHLNMVWEVEGCDSAGMDLRAVAPYRSSTLMRVTDERDLEGMSKVRKPRKPRAKKEPTNG